MLLPCLGDVPDTANDALDGGVAITSKFLLCLSAVNTKCKYKISSRKYVPGQRKNLSLLAAK